MRNIRTDLALEATELWREQEGDPGELSGVRTRTNQREGYPVTVVEVLSPAGEQAVNKPMGTYVTLELDDLLDRLPDAFPRAARALAAELRPFLPQESDAPVLVVGLGNRAITPDAVGPRTADHTMVTRHLVEREPAYFSRFRPVAALAAGVLASTGVESVELVRAVVDRIRPACVVAVDALAARSVRRLCRTVQIASSGIIPGSGVGNARKALNQETLGVPVVALGVPTVVDAATLAADLAGEGAGPLDDAPSLIVTPKDIDAHTADVSKVLGYGINLALQDGLTVEDIDLFLS
jgi:spore protease